MTNLHVLNIPQNSGIQTPGTTQVLRSATVAGPPPAPGGAANEALEEGPASRETSPAPENAAGNQRVGDSIIAEDSAACIRELKVSLAAAKAWLANRPQLFNMATEPDVLAALAAAAPKEPPKRTIVGRIIPGFKTDTLDSAIPPKVDAAYAYIPYSALTKAARIKALHGDEVVIITASGLSSRSLDHSNECTISTLEWMDVSEVHITRTRHHVGDQHADALKAHQAIVLKLASHQGAEADAWPLAIAYDIQQQEVAAANHAHDLSTLNTVALQLITNQLLLSHSFCFVPPSLPLFLPAAPHSPSKRPAHHPSFLPDSPNKPPRLNLGDSPVCFRCGPAVTSPKTAQPCKPRWADPPHASWETHGTPTASVPPTIPHTVSAGPRSPAAPSTPALTTTAAPFVAAPPMGQAGAAPV
ncbi:hypothetical protein BDQ17DRAFT_1325796 [Cyathus striatus]|nr:hypothetical protein BDQ17DRAFT_1325796 [Cyathus striatus]